MVLKYGPLNNSLNAFGLAKSFDRILKVARTIADLEGISTTDSSEVSEGSSTKIRGADVVGRFGGAQGHRPRGDFE